MIRVLVLIGVALAAFLYDLPAVAQQLRHAQPQARVLSRVDSSARTTLAHTHPASIVRATVGARLPSSTPLSGMVLVLQPSAAQQAALAEEMQAQQDRNSPSFHHWLTPDTFAESYGVAAADIAAVTAWLQNSGFTVEQVSRSARFVTFSGTAGTVEQAFRTEMHHVQRNGEAHISNTTDLSIPTALAPVVRGLARLDDFYHSNAAIEGTPVVLRQTAAGRTIQPASETTEPAYGTSATGLHYLAPGDAAVIYNALPLTNAGVDGRGTTIGVLGRSNVSATTVAAFRSLFGLPANAVNVTVVGTDPGIGADATETYLDVEWAGALATGSTVQLITSASSATADGITTASLYAVDHNIGDILTLSYGECETDATASGTAFWNSLWQQAAAQGQTVFVSTGDSGAAGCNASSDGYADQGYGVNALGSSAYNVAVGGTMFVDYGPSQFWGAAAGSPYASALGYIPEAAWNQGRLGTTDLNATYTGTVQDRGIVAGGGGVSIDTARPAWQTGSLINPTADPFGIAAGSTITGPHRLVPDVSMPASYGHDGNLFCGTGMCTGTGTQANLGVVGGTSLAAPLMASAQALINAKNGGRQGNANVIYYALAAKQNTAGLNCQSATGTASNPTVTAPDSTCDFHDIVTGSNTVPTAAGGSAGIGFSAIGGYDTATGLGSVNIANLANDWGSVTTATSSTVAFTLSPTTATHGSAQTFTAAVTPGSGTGTPTGSVVLVMNGVTGTQQYTLSAASVTGTVGTLPAGTYNVHAHYSGDSTFAASDSADIAVTITAEASTITVTPQHNGAAANTFTYADGLLALQAAVAGRSGKGTPTGTVTFTLPGMPAYTATLGSNGTASLLSGTGSLANYAVLPAGTYTAAVAYSGDTNFLASTGTISFTVIRATPAAQLTTAGTVLVANSPAVLQFTIAGAAATGTVQIADGATALCTATLQSGSAACTASSLSNGHHTLTATYSGDTNYLPGSTILAVTVASSSAPLLTLTAAPATVFPGIATTLTATIFPAPAAATPVRFLDGASLLGTATAAAGTGIAILPVATFNTGTHALTAASTASATQAAATGQLALVVSPLTTALTLAAPSSNIAGQATLTAVLTRTPGNSSAALTGALVLLDGNSTVATATPVAQNNGTYAATFSLAALPAGAHTLSATYAGDANNLASTAAPLQLTLLSTDIAVVLAPVTTQYGTATTTVSATVSTTQAGRLTIAADGNPAVSAACTVAAATTACTAALPTATFATGTHTLTAVFTAVPTGATTTLNVSGTGSLTVVPATALLTLAALDVPYDGNPHAVTVTTTPASLAVAVTYSGQSAAPTAVGNYTVAATVKDTNYTGTTTGTLHIAPAAARLTFTVPAHRFGDAAFPVTATSTSTGTVTYTVVSGPAAVTGNTVALTGAGTVVLQAAQAATGNYAAGSATATFVAQQASTALTLAASANPATTGSPVMFTATLTSTVPSTGSIAFLSDGTPLGSAALANGTATFTFTLTGGTHTLTATYAGTANIAAATATLTQTVGTGSTFTLTAAAGTTATVASGQAATLPVVLTPSATFTGTVALSCADLPTTVTCTFSRPSFTFAGAATAQTVSVSFTEAPQQAAVAPTTASTHLALIFGLPGLLLAGVTGRKRLPRALLLLLVGAGSLWTGGVLTGCGVAPNGSAQQLKTATGTYTVHVLATAGSTVQTVPVTLTLQ